MGFIHTFFSLNHEIIYFGYGLVFFILGLAIALQSRSYSRLDLARSLKWLAAFGFTHAFNEWGDLFIPIQADYLNPQAISILHNLHLMLLAVSFALLFEFGVTLLKPLGRERWLHGISSALLAIWIFVAFFPLHVLVPDPAAWENTANALARYFIGFPGGMLAAYGLRQNTLSRILPLQVPHIVKMLRFGGIMMALYAVFGGLVPPPIPFFPGNIINSDTFETALLAPPAVFRSLVGLGLAIAIIRALEVFDLETNSMIESMERQQILTAERDRIARDLHDGAIQKVYSAGLLVESAAKLASSDEKLSGRLQRAQNVLNDAIHDLRRNLGELYARPIEEPFEEALQNLVADPRFRSLVDIRLVMDLPVTSRLSQMRADHILAIVHEAISNAVRHGKPSHIKVSAQSAENRLKISIVDDGVGLPEELEAGYGLRNMRDRARLLGGQLEIASADGKGTRVELELPWMDEKG